MCAGGRRGQFVPRLPTGKDFLSVLDLKKNPNYDFMDILNDEQNDNDFIYGYNSDVNESPYNNVNFNCDYYDENETISKFANNRGDLLCCSLNIQSLPSKFIEFSDLFSLMKVYFDVICLQELWTLHDSTMFNIEGYNFINKGRKSGVRGAFNQECESIHKIRKKGINVVVRFHYSEIR